MCLNTTSCDLSFQILHSLRTGAATQPSSARPGQPGPRTPALLWSLTLHAHPDASYTLFPSQANYLEILLSLFSGSTHPSRPASNPRDRAPHPQCGQHHLRLKTPRNLSSPRAMKLSRPHLGTSLGPHVLSGTLFELSVCQARRHTIRGQR